jgi:hypothetical protein
MKQLRTPGRVHRLKRYVEAQLPVHAQYIPVGTVYFRGAQCAFGFRHRDDDAADGLFDRRPAAAGQRGIHARLVTPLTSATSQKGEAEEAVISEPLLDGDHELIH